MSNRVLFYTDNIDDVATQQFYQIDFDIIRSLGMELVVTDKIREVFKPWKYDILFEYFYTWGFFKAFLFKLFGKRVYFTGGIDALNRNTSTKKSFLLQKLFFFLCYLVSTKCFIVSDTDWENIKAVYKGRLKSKLVKSYHVIDVAKFKNDNIFDREKLFVTICWQGSQGNVIRKGVDKALKLFSYLNKKKEFAQYRFAIIGKPGPGTSFIVSLINELDVNDKVTLLGAVSESDKIDLLKKAKYYFQISKYEGFGLAALEAIASGDIVIHSNEGGLKYVVGDNGVIVGDLSENDMERIYLEMINFDTKKIQTTQKWVEANFTYDKRKAIFSKFFI